MTARSRPILRASALAAALVGPTGGAMGADPVTIPASAREVEGNSDNLYPFNGNPMRYQQVIAASEFPAKPRTIRKIALRVDSAAGSGFSESLGHVRIGLSTSARTPANLSRTFAENLGADATTVYDGRLALSSAFAGPSGGPKEFDVVITFDTPFAYDPAKGSLLIDVRNFSGGKTTQFDAHDAPDSTARVWSDEVDAPIARAGDPFPSVGLVIRFLGD